MNREAFTSLPARARAAFAVRAARRVVGVFADAEPPDGHEADELVAAIGVIERLITGDVDADADERIPVVLSHLAADADKRAGAHHGDPDLHRKMLAARDAIYAASAAYALSRGLPERRTIDGCAGAIERACQSASALSHDAAADLERELDADLAAIAAATRDWPDDRAVSGDALGPLWRTPSRDERLAR